MPYEILHVPKFGGGLNFSAHPANIGDDEWSWSNGYFARDGYAETCVAIDTSGQTSFMTGGYTATGIIPDPFDDGQFIVTANNGVTGKIYQVPDKTEITPSASATPAINTSLPSFVFFENNLYVSHGLKTAGANFTLARIAPSSGATPSTYTRIDEVSGATITGALAAAYLEVCRDHIIAAAVDRLGSGVDRVASRTVAWCDSLRPEFWDVKMYASSTIQEWTELPRGITGLARADADTVLVFCTDRIIALKYTGANPPFVRAEALVGEGQIHGKTVTQISTPGLGTRGRVAKTPIGVVWYGDANVYRWGNGPEPLADKIRHYFREKATLTTRPMSPIWHGHWGMLFFPISVGGTFEIMMYDPNTQAWSRRVLNSTDMGSTTPVDHCYYSGANAVSAGEFDGKWAILITTGNVLTEHATLTTPYSGAFVDTKDFTFGNPASNDYIDRIQVDWEPLTNSTTDAIIVQTAVRDDFSKSVLGSLGGETALSFTTQGTLTGGNSELALRLRGKFVRFRFLQSSGRARIRGFTIRWQRGSERAS